MGLLPEESDLLAPTLILFAGTPAFFSRPMASMRGSAKLGTRPPESNPLSSPFLPTILLNNPVLLPVVVVKVSTLIWLSIIASANSAGFSLFALLLSPFKLLNLGLAGFLLNLPCLGSSLGSIPRKSPKYQLELPEVFTPFSILCLN